jgi:hypothetical protein
MPPGPYAPFSFVTLLVLLGVLGLSCLTFWLIVRRATSHRRWVALSDWGRSRGFRYHPIGAGELPEPFSLMSIAAPPTVRLWMASKTAQLIQMQPAQPPTLHASAAAAAAAPPPATWHVLIRHVESTWPPTALRPTAKEDTLLDHFALASFPAMISSERFVIFGADAAAAPAIARSSLPALLPPDIGLLLHGQRMVLDFSNRPFDTIEFDRMLALANHLLGHLPRLKR